MTGKYPWDVEERSNRPNEKTEQILGRRISDQSAERIKQLAALAHLRGNLKVILENGPKVPDLNFRARQYYVALEQSEKIVCHIIESMNKASR